MSELAKRAAAFLAMFGALLAILISALIIWHVSSRGREEPEGAQLEPILAEEEPAGPVDLDASVRAMLDLDAFLAESSELDDYLRRSARQDWSRVAPDVRRAREAILAQLEEIARLQAESRVHEKLWDWPRSLLAAARVVNLGGKASLTELSLSAGLDSGQAARVSKEYAEHLLEGGRFDLQSLLAEARLKGLVQGYVEVAFRHVKAWDALCAERDQAMLAALNGHFDRAIAHAEAAIEMSPAETEAHLILAMALIEAGDRKAQVPPEIQVTRPGEIPAENPHAPPAEWARADEILKSLIARAPERAAPARLLQGVLAIRRGEEGLARDRLEFASAHFPKQAEALTRNLRSLQARARYLSRSRAGLRILRAHSAMAQGAGYFSPDLQLARLNFRNGDFGMGRKRILDHFARRRAQRNWEFILSDLQYAYRAFGADFRSIFPAESFLDLLPDKTWFGLGADMKIELANRSDRSLHNATLVLCARFTDMQPDDYATLALDTVEKVPAGETVTFGTYEPHFRVHGGLAQGKMIHDSLRAILVSDQAVVWVDTSAAREREHAEVARDLAKGLPRPELALSWLVAEPEVLAGEVFAGAELSIRRNTVIKDLLSVKLPAKVSVVRPMFRLSHGDSMLLRPDDERIEDGFILLDFRLDLKDPEDLPEIRTLLPMSPSVAYEVLLRRRDESGYGLERVLLKAT